MISQRSEIELFQKHNQLSWSASPCVLLRDIFKRLAFVLTFDVYYVLRCATSSACPQPKRFEAGNINRGLKPLQRNFGRGRLSRSRWANESERRHGDGMAWHQA